MFDVHWGAVWWCNTVYFLSFEWQMEGSSFEMIFFGEGYSTGQNPQEGKPDVKICTQVKGPGRTVILEQN